MLPNITIELRHLKKDLYESRIFSPEKVEILRSEFTFKDNDPFFVRGTAYLEGDGQRRDKDIDRGFIQRMGKHFYDLITDGKDDFKNHLRHNKELKAGYCLTLALDYKIVKEKSAGIERLSRSAHLLWHVPWEYLHDGDDFLALTGRAHVTRKPIGLGELPALISPQPLRLLVVVSSPNKLTELNSEKEIGTIQEVLDEPRRNGWLEFDFLEIATIGNIRSKIKHFRPHILHYTGHGGKDEDTNETYLACEDDDGNEKPVYGRDLRRITQDSDTLQLVVLSGCMTAQTHHHNALKGVATTLLQDSLPAVLAMQYSILDRSGIEFARKFYEELGKGSSLVEAVNEVRLRLHEMRGGDRADWGLPALYLRAPEIRLIDKTLPPKPGATEAERVDIGGLPVVRGFVGRKNEIRNVRQAISDPQIPVVYVWGLGGIGKTALAAKIIEKVDFDKSVDAVCVIRCNTIEPTFANLVEKLANFISYQGKEGHARAGQQLRDSTIPIDERVSLVNNAVKDHRYLFIFDNFESLFVKRAPVGEINDQDLTAFFSHLFDHNWRSTFLFTCRYQWQLLTETRDGGRGLKCGLPTENLLAIHLPGLTAHQTVQHMYNLAGPLSKLKYEEQSRLLPLIKGHPKTVELLDSYLKVHNLAEVLEDEELKGKMIEEIGIYFMDGLWQDLNTDEQEALAILAVFRVPLKSKDIQRLVPKKEALNKLKGYSLVQVEGEGRGFVVHPVVNEYVFNKIGKEERQKLHRKAADFYIHQHDDLLQKLSEDVKAEPLQGLCAVMRMLASGGMRADAVGMTSSLLEIHYHLFEAQEYQQASRIVTAVLRFLSIEGLRETAKELLRKSVSSLKSGDRYVAMGNLATLLNREGRWQEALDTYQKCLDFFKEVDAKSQVAGVISQQAQIYQERGEYGKALKLEQESLALEEQMDNEEGIVISHYRIAQLLDCMEKYDEALKEGKKGLRLAQDLHHPLLEAGFLHQLGLTLNSLNRPKEAFEHFSKSLDISERIGGKAGQADSLGEIGKLLRRARQFKGALDCFQQALNIQRDLGDPGKVAMLIQLIGGVFESQGHHQEALIKYQEALQLHREYGRPQLQAALEQHIARAKKLLGQ